MPNNKKSLDIDRQPRRTLDTAYRTFKRTRMLIDGLRGIGLDIMDSNDIVDSGNPDKDGGSLYDTLNDMIAIMADMIGINPFDDAMMERFREIIENSVWDYPDDYIVNGDMVEKIKTLMAANMTTNMKGHVS